MTVRELREALKDAPPDAHVELSTWDDGCQGGDYCGEYAEYVEIPLKTIEIRPHSNLVILKEGS